MALVEFETEGAVAVIRFNRPAQCNAVSLALMTEFRAAVDRFEDDPHLRVAILTGAGKHFCAGMDLGAFGEDGIQPGVKEPDRFAGFVARQRRKPVIAAVNGGAYAGGLEIMLACDMAIAARDARFALPEVKRGLIAGGGGAFRLSQMLPKAVANRMLLTGDPIDAQTAAAFGLVCEVVEPADLMAAAMTLARQIAANAPLAIEATLALSNAAAHGDEARHWVLSDRLWAGLDGSHDAREGALAFVEKRAPRWTGA